MTGRALSATDSVPLAQVRVGIVAFGFSAETDSAGRFVLLNVPRRDVRVAFGRLDIVPDTVTLAAQRDTITVYLRPAAVAIAPVVVAERSLARERFEEVAQTSTVSLDAVEIQRVPALLEADVIRAVQLLPGTVAKNDYSIGYNVRGGESDQNLVQLDGFPVFNPSHLAGLFSTFDDDAISRVDFFTGGFPAGYGGRLSSILDISLRNGNPRSVDVHGQVSLLATKALVEGPIGSGGTTFMLGGRRTYADILVAAFSREELPYYFTDAIGKVSAPLAGGAFSITGYWGRDILDLNLVEEAPDRDPVTLAFNWGNTVLGANYTRPFGSRVLESRVGLSTFTTTLGLLPDLARFDNRAYLVTARADLALSPRQTHEVRIGAGLERYAISYGIGSASLETTFLDVAFKPTILSLYADDQWHPFGRLLVRPGARLDYVSGADVLTVSPRISFKAFLSDDRALTGSAGRFYQAIHSIRDQELPVTIYEFWISADPYIPVARSDHLVLGLEQWFGPNLSMTIEGYRKTFHNLVTPNRAGDLQTRGDDYIPTSGHAWGTDILLRKHAGRFRGWVAYSFTKAMRDAQGVAFPPAHDRRHTLNVVLQADGPLGSEMGVRWGFGSPLPYTGWVGQWEHRRYNPVDNSWTEYIEEEPISAEINGERYPPYSRLDMSLRWRLRTFGGVLQPYVQVVNVYNRRNVFLYFFDYGDVPTTRNGVSQLPLLPTLGLEFSW